MKSTPPNAQLVYVGLHVRDVERLLRPRARLRCHRRRLLRHGRRDRLPRPGPTEHHQFVLTSGRSAPNDGTLINQISFHVGSLEDLIVYQGLVAAKMVKVDPTHCPLEDWTARMKERLAT